MEKKILLELEHGASIETARKFVTEKMKENNITGEIKSIEKNNWMSFWSDTGCYYFDVVIQ